MEKKISPTVLMILDGFGIADPKNAGNAITQETAPHIFDYMKRYPTAMLEASGEKVGLFHNQEGNSEAGHMTIGAGRVVKQDLVHISEAIHEGTFFKNSAFKQALFHAKKYKRAVHILVLLTDEESAHSYPEHLYAMLEFLRQEEQSEVYLHLFTDGRDSSPHEANTFLHELRGHMLAHEKIATIMGRFYAMDRNKNWDRTRAAYEAIVNGDSECAAESAEDAIAQSYNRGDTDEYIRPTVIMKGKHPVAKVKDNDVVFFVNARSDRARQLTKAFVQKDFHRVNPGAFHRSRMPRNIRFVTMTDFGPDLPGILTAFPSPDVPKSLAAVINSNYRQLYISESEKYAHVTYFINGGYAEPLNGEHRECVPSVRIHSYAEKPEMHSALLAQKVIDYLKTGAYNFICVNFPNADMVGHTGNFEAAKLAVRAVDDAAHAVVGAALGLHGQVLIVGDHGNAEQMINEKTGEVFTEHTTNPVPFILARDEVKKSRVHKGTLADVAPTVLNLMGISKSKEMTGSVLFS